MIAKKVWARSTNGPDATDVETLMRAIGGLHTGRVALQCSPIGIGSTGGLSISVMMTFDRLPGSSLPECVNAETQYPSKDGREFWGMVFELLYQLDYRISQVYKNEELWK